MHIQIFKYRIEFNSNGFRTCLMKTIQSLREIKFKSCCRFNHLISSLLATTENRLPGTDSFSCPPQNLTSIVTESDFVDRTKYYVTRDTTGPPDWLAVTLSKRLLERDNQLNSFSVDLEFLPRIQDEIKKSEEKEEEDADDVVPVPSLSDDPSWTVLRIVFHALDVLILVFRGTSLYRRFRKTCLGPERRFIVVDSPLTFDPLRSNHRWSDVVPLSNSNANEDSSPPFNASNHVTAAAVNSAAKSRGSPNHRTDSKLDSSSFHRNSICESPP